LNAKPKALEVMEGSVQAVMASTSLCIVGPSQFGFNLSMLELKMFCYKPESLKLQKNFKISTVLFSRMRAGIKPGTFCQELMVQSVE
jgi:hypothetical protein